MLPPTDPDDLREPDRHVGYLIRRAQQRHVAAWSRIVSAETTSVQYSLLVVLDRGEASQRELCDAVDLDRSTIADLVARMERRGLVERHRSRIDARRNTVTLTARGREERRLLQPLVARLQQHLVARMSPAEVASLTEGLRALLR